MSQAKINTVITNDNSQFKKSIGDCDKQVSGMSKGALGNLGKEVAGAFAVSAVVAWGKAQLEAADNLVTLAGTLGVTTDAMQALYSSGRHNNINVEGIDGGLSKLAKAQDEVINGNKNFIETFDRLGLSAEQVAGMDIQQLFEAVAKGAQNSATAIGDCSDIFGKGMGVKMTPLLKEVADVGFQGVIDKAKEAGEVIDAVTLKEMANTADEMEHAFKRASDWLVKGLSWVADKVKDISALIGAWSAVGFIKGLDQLAKGEIGSKADRKIAEDEVAKEKADKALEQIQKVEQQKKNVKLKAEEDYQKELKKIMDKMDDEEEKRTQKRKEQAKKRRQINEDKVQVGVEKQKNIDEANKDYYGEQSNVGKGIGVNANIANSLQSQGAGLGQVNTGVIAIAEQQLKVTERMEELNKKHNELLNKINIAADKQNAKLDEQTRALNGTD